MVTGDGAFAALARHLRQRGIRVEVTFVAQTLGAGLKTAANGIIDLAKLLAGFKPLTWPPRSPNLEALPLTHPA